jgi:IclR family transcriptional regulator, KDG regulon repressor
MNAKTRSKPRYDAPAVRVAVRILNVLCAARQPLGVSEISRAIDQNKSLTYRLLATLRDEGWVLAEEPGPRYRVTLTPFRIFSQSVNEMDVRAAAAGPLRELWDALGESVYLAVLHDDASLYLEHLNSRQSVRIAGMVGGSYPLYCTAPGKVLLAHGGPELFERICMRGLPPATDNTLIDPKALDRHLAEIRQRGWATDNEEFGRGILCFASPVFDHHGACVAAMGTSVTTIGRTIDDVIRQIGPLVRRAAQETSALLGSSTPASADPDPVPHKQPATKAKRQTRRARRQP